MSIRPALASSKADLTFMDRHYRYYSLAHAVHEKIFKQPSMLAVGILRDYQMVMLVTLCKNMSKLDFHSALLYGVLMYESLKDNFTFPEKQWYPTVLIEGTLGSGVIRCKGAIRGNLSLTIYFFSLL